MLIDTYLLHDHMMSATDMPSWVVQVHCSCLLLQVHRWGAAFPAKPFGSPCLKAETAQLAACGDFCLGAGIENAVLSGQAAAEAMSEMLAAVESRL
jgi:predicted NAD/FAD-dependent oxidoreductase